MTPSFPGNYFDGQSAKPQQAFAEIANGSLRISIPATNYHRDLHAQDVSTIEQVSNDRLLIRFGKEAAELLDVRSEEFIRMFKQEFPHVKGGQNFLERFANSGWKGISALVAALIGVVLLVYFFIIPWTGDLAARFFPQKYEEQLGGLLYKSIIREYAIDSSKTELLNELVRDVDFKTSYDLNIIVVDYDVKNAFAMPGGHIVVFSGIMKDMHGYPELMGLLAHEVSHVNERHTLRALFRSLSSYIFISVLLNDINGLTTIVLENANSIKSLSFSRSLEQEADMEGLQILFHNHVDPNGMIDLFRNLMEDGDIPEEMEFLSTHPVTEKRLSYIEEKIKESDCTVKHNDHMQEVWEKLHGD